MFWLDQLYQSVCYQIDNQLQAFIQIAKNNGPMVWGKDFQTTFEKIRTQPLNPPVLVLPYQDASINVYGNPRLLNGLCARPN